MFHQIYVLTLLLLFISCNESKKEVNNGKSILKITNGNLDSISQNDKDQMNELKNSLPKSYADTVVFKTNEEYEKRQVSSHKPKVFRSIKLEDVDHPNYNPGKKVETLTLIYNAISCTCAQWSETRFNNEKNEKKLYWLEPANNKLLDADALFNGDDLPLIVKVTGQIVTENGFPQRKLAKTGPENASIVFRYTKIKVIQNGKKKNVH